MPQVTGLICDDINIMMIHNHRIKISDCSASLNCSKFGSLFTSLYKFENQYRYIMGN